MPLAVLSSVILSLSLSACLSCPLSSSVCHRLSFPLGQVCRWSLLTGS